MASDRESLRIPARLNLVLLVLAAVACAALLAAASRASSAWLMIACAVAFSYAANTVFSLLHESVHGILHPVAAVNRWAGRFAAAFFPTAPSIQRAYHLTHHRNNRSPHERFDYLQPGDSVWLKRAQWYSILTGFYWVVSVLGLALYFLVPWSLRGEYLRSRRVELPRGRPPRPRYLVALDAVPPVTARLRSCCRPACRR